MIAPTSDFRANWDICSAVGLLYIAVRWSHYPPWCVFVRCGVRVTPPETGDAPVSTGIRR
jgi:hypothetical protein